MLIILWGRLLVTRWKWEVASNFTGKLPDELLKDKAPEEKKCGSECLMVNHFL